MAHNYQLQTMPQVQEELWKPSTDHINNALITDFFKTVGLSGADYSAAHRWSIENREEFWSAVWDFCGVVGEKGNEVLREADRMPGARWFPDAQLNFAENLLRGCEDSEALIFWDENGIRARFTRKELFQATASCAAALRAAGINAGDRVAAYLPNIPETVIVMLAVASIGAVF